MHATIENQVKRGQDPTRAYLHIGKTGGTSFLATARALAETQPERAPIFFSHDWTVPRIREALPDARISLVIRDPLERIISGFMSRERAGRPTYDSPWSTDEAITFMFFENVSAFLKALISPTPREAAAAEFASRSIAHIRRGYRYCLPDTQDIAAWAGTIGRFEDIPGFASRVLGGDVEVGHMHANPTSATEILAALLPEEHSRLTAHFASEYEVYHALRLHAC